MIRQIRHPYVVVAVLMLPAAIRLATWPSSKAPGVDLAAADEGRKLFEHVWTASDPLAHGGDGLGPVFNAESCVACHRQGGAGGSGSRSENVTTFTVRPVEVGQVARQGVVHARAVNVIFQESLWNVHPSLPTAIPLPPSTS